MVTTFIFFGKMIFIVCEQKNRQKKYKQMLYTTYIIIYKINDQLVIERTAKMPDRKWQWLCGMYIQNPKKIRVGPPPLGNGSNSNKHKFSTSTQLRF